MSTIIKFLLAAVAFAAIATTVEAGDQHVGVSQSPAKGGRGFASVEKSKRFHPSKWPSHRQYQNSQLLTESNISPRLITELQEELNEMYEILEVSE